MKKVVSLLVIGLFFASCKKENTVWESDWSTPLINDTLSLDNLVNDSTLTESGGFYQLELNRTLFDINLADSISIDTAITESFTIAATLTLSPGFSFVNSVEEHDIGIEDFQLKIMNLKEGFIDVKVDNPLETITFFEVKLPGVTKNGVEFVQEYEVPAKVNGVAGVIEQTINLTGYQLDLTGVSGGEFNLLRSQITAKTDPLGPSVQITPVDVTKVKATFRGVKVDYARGYFGSKLFLDTSDVFIDLLAAVESGTIDLPASVIQFEIENGIKVNAQASLTALSSENSSGTVLNLTGANIGAQFNIDAATGSWNSLVPSFKTIEFNNMNSNIEAYLENLGSNHIIINSIQINPWGNVSGSWDELFPNSKLKVRMKASMPLAIGIDDLILKDTFDVVLNQDPDKTRIKSGELFLQLSNGFPIAGAVKIHLLNENGDVLHSIFGSNEIASSLSGNLSAEYGFYVSDSEIQFVLSEDVLENINDVKALIIESGFNTINPTTGLVEQMSIPFGAFLSVKMKTKFTTENKF